MLPSITPPTDNLYKFVSLFGLAIFLFALYNVGIVYDQSANNKVRIEELKIKVQKALFEKTHEIDPTLRIDTTRRFRPAMIRRLGSDIQKIESLIEHSGLDDLKIYELGGEAGKLKVKLDALWLKQYLTIFFVFVGVVTMFFGFRLWKRKEQDIRDKILEIEHIIKQKERDRKSKKRRKRSIKPFCVR